MTVEEVKRRLIVKTLEATGNISEAAGKLGISSRTIYNKIHEWNCLPESFSNGRALLRPRRSRSRERQDPSRLDSTVRRDPEAAFAPYK
jgi:transposase-like protein